MATLKTHGWVSVGSQGVYIANITHFDLLRFRDGQQLAGNAQFEQDFESVIDNARQWEAMHPDNQWAIARYLIIGNDLQKSGKNAILAQSKNLEVTSLEFARS